MSDRMKIRAVVQRLRRELGGGGEQRDVNLDELIAYIDSMPEEPVSESIEDEFERFAYSLPHSATGFWPKDIDAKSVEARIKYGVLHEWSYEQVKKIASHFAEWQKQRVRKEMVKDMVNATVCHRKGNVGDIYFQSDNVLSAKYPFKYGERIKIIIVKENNS